MPDNASITFVDYSSETSTVRFNITDVTDVNFAATIAAIADMQTVIEGITIGNPVRRGLSTSVGTSLGAPTTPLAQREGKWLVGFRSVTAANEDFGRNYTAELPCADLTLLTSGTDFLFKAPEVLPAGPILDFVNQWEAQAKTPEGSDVEVTYIRYAGRNL